MTTETQIELDNLIERIDELSDRGHARSALRVARELQRRAKSDQDLNAYVSACFRLMTEASHQFDPQTGRDAALELICVLENEDYARTIDPDLDLEDYEYMVWGRSSCAYDNLATNIGMIKGFNSDGMQQCIKDGLEICRKTGKTQCVSCFRIYSIEVYAASDDLEMALHFATVAANMDSSNLTDQRLNGRYNLVLWNPVAGRLEQAIKAAYLLIESLAEEEDSPRLHANAYLMLEELELISGHRLTNQLPAPEFPPQSENLEIDWMRDRNAALRSCIQGEIDPAIELLSKWDRVFLKRECMSHFFRNRLQLMSALRFAGQNDKLESLADELNRHAETASDWLTMRLCRTILESETYDRPVASLLPFPIGPFTQSQAPTDNPNLSINAAAQQNADLPQQSTTLDLKDSVDKRSDSLAEEQSDEPNRLPPFLETVYQQIHDAYQIEEDEQRVRQLTNIREELMGLAGQQSSAQEAKLLLHCMTGVLTSGQSDALVWSWARKIAGAYMQDGECLSMLAELGCALKFSDPEEDAIIDEDQLEDYFKMAMTLSPESAKVHRQAGRFFAFRKHIGDAERCYARAFRLDRTDTTVVLALADIYRRTDRAQDALAALDMSVRAGNDSHEVSWTAAIDAFHQERYVATLSYLDRYESQVQNNPWTSYYQILSQIELSRFDDAERTHASATQMQEHLQAASIILDTCIKGNKQDQHGFSEGLERVLDIRLSEVHYLTESSLTSLFFRLWTLAEGLGVSSELHQLLNRRMLESGLASNEYLESIRSHRPQASNLNYYECVIVQPLDSDWPQSPACLADQQSWSSYSQSWGVLASDEQKASEFVLELQSQCYHLTPRILSIELVADEYKDFPGVCWQGSHENAPDSVD